MEDKNQKTANPVEDKSFSFALEIINICRDLSSNKKEFVLSRQLLKSGTSIGANITETQQAQSKADFISKMNIALKEAYETRYWLRLLGCSDYIGKDETKVMLDRVDELIRLLVMIVKNSKQKQEN